VIKKVSIKNPHIKVPESPDSWVEKRENRKRLTIDVPVSIHTKLKIVAAKRGMTMAEIIYNVLEKELNNIE
jgi:macrodomain Ter protein organizer (MatP/YcbG family)